MKCDNCEADFEHQTEGLAVLHEGGLAAGICRACCEGVAVGKIALERNARGEFTYAQWAPLELMAQRRTQK